MITMYFHHWQPKLNGFCRRIFKHLNQYRPIKAHLPSLKKLISIILASLLSTGLISGIRTLGILQPLELESFDRIMRLNSDNIPDPRLLIVEITEADIQTYQKWPFSDEILALALAKLQEYQPRVIGFDIYRDVPQPPGHLQIVEQFQADNIIAIKQIGTVDPPPSISTNQVGFNDLVSDLDNTIRRNLMYVRYDGEELYSFGVKVSQKYLESLKNHPIILDAQPGLLQIDETIFPAIRSNSGGYQLPASEVGGRQILMDYHTKEIAKTITITELLQGEIDGNLVKDKVVLIGTTATSSRDLHPTPFSAAKTTHHLMPGVMIHGYMISQILKVILEGESLFWFLPMWGEVLWLWLWSFLGGILVVKFHRPLSLGLLISISTIALWTICFIVFCQKGWIPLIPPALGLLFTGAIVLAYKVIYGLSYDILTDLPTRILLNQKIQRLSNQSKYTQIALLFLDLDRFRLINEGFGHAIGDQLLISTTQRMKKCLYSQTILARVGGDEFAVMMPNIQNIDQAIAMANKLQKALAAPFYLNGQQVYTTISIGIAYSNQNQDLVAHDLLRDAHTAMYRAKALGNSRYQVYISTMKSHALQQLQLEADLREAIKNQEFQLYYQPIINLKTNQIAGFEALVRWISPQRGFVSPGEFIPVSEESGLIIPLGEWILLEGCRQLAIWNQKYCQNDPFMLSINLSTRQFSQVNLIECVDQILTQTGVDRSCIKLEITESAIMDDVDEAIALLERLKALGIKLSMDDFGTGYSSLSYLHRFPIDTLKVDQSFVRRMDDSQQNTEIVKTIIMLGHNLNMDIVAEGIEIEGNVQTLKNLNCEYGQGYFFSKPLPVTALEDLLNKTLYQS
ncbi:EAL domain-containing protein [Limnospira fusiformis]|uniref:EAL domain-containing protein n=1 Tax=Limnospira fusiformis TaxID=54297 RepID=UPI001448A666|nr:EAL domain-containing protein [Limnospira fusiformis SAG 85.79]